MRGLVRLFQYALPDTRLPRAQLQARQGCRGCIVPDERAKVLQVLLLRQAQSCTDVLSRSAGL